MKVKRARYCAECKKGIKAEVEFSEYSVVQKCPICGSVVAEAGAFYVSGPQTVDPHLGLFGAINRSGHMTVEIVDDDDPSWLLEEKQ